MVIQSPLPRRRSSFVRACLVASLALISCAPSGARGAPVADPLHWTAQAAAPTTLYEGQGAVVDGRLYLMGGFDHNADDQPIATVKCWVYDPASDHWTRLADLPEKITHAGVAVDGRSIYLAGGFVGDHPGPQTDHVWRYDVTGDRWSARLPLPAARAGGALVLLNRELHYFGGTSRDPNDLDVYQQDYGDHWVLNLTGGTAWTSAAPLPNPRNHMAGVALDGVIYALGGQHLGDEMQSNQADVQAYTAAQGWQARASLPRPMGHIGAATLVWQGHILVVGGVTQGHQKSDQVFEYDPQADHWTSLAPLPAPRQATVAGAVAGGLAVTGGEDDGGPTDTVWFARY